MRFPIRPGKVTCAGVVAILMVLPNSIWKGADAKVEPTPRVKITTARTDADSPRARVKLREVPR
ncbi:MAG: hypothetical protein EHM55_05620 [Acidobacteria bacterium]|nr:MAG: hypothetical protein EHM55_05620 [Acidobacteriota bacterium]